MNWNIVYRLNDPNEKYSLFHHLLSRAVDEYFPLKKSKRWSLDKPWLTSELKELIIERQKAFCTYDKSSSQYKDLRIKVKFVIRDVKVKYFNVNIKKLKDGDSSKWWKITKQLIGVSKGSTWFKQLLDDMTLYELWTYWNDKWFLCQLNSWFWSTSCSWQHNRGYHRSSRRISGLGWWLLQWAAVW